MFPLSCAHVCAHRLSDEHKLKNLERTFNFPFFCLYFIHVVLDRPIDEFG